MTLTRQQLNFGLNQRTRPTQPIATVIGSDFRTVGAIVQLERGTVANRHLGTATPQRGDRVSYRQGLTIGFSG